jgi:hypothetical protein
MLAAKVGGGVFLTIALAIGLLYVRLLQGPISLDFLVSPIEAGIAEELAGPRVSIEQAAVRLGEGGQIQFQLKNVRVADAAGAPLAVAPTAAVSLSRKALLRGRLAAESIDLISPRLQLFFSEDGTLSVKFAQVPDGIEADRPKAPPLRGSIGPAPAATGEAEGGLGRIDLVKVLSDASARARRREHAGAFLREIGLKSASVIIDTGNRKSIWRVPELNIDLDHRRSRSSIAGRAKIESLSGPFEANFRIHEVDSAKSLQLTLSVQGLVPRGLARTLPQLASLESFDLPVWVDARLELSNLGQVLSGKIEVNAAPGQVYLPWLAATPLRLDGAQLELSYSSAARRFEIAPSTLVMGDGRIRFAGSVAHTAQGAEGAGWQFEIRSNEGFIVAEPPGLQRLPIEHLTARGFLAPERGRVVLSQFLLRTGGSEVSAEGDVSDMGGAMKARLEGKLGTMQPSVFKTLWPSGLAPATRQWIGQHLVRGTLQGGSFKLISAPGAAGQGWTPVQAGNHASLLLDAVNVELALLDGWPGLDVPRVQVQIEGTDLKVVAPDASFAAADGRRLALKGTLAVDLNQPLPRTGLFDLRGAGALSLALEMLDQPPLQILHNGGFTLDGIEGNVDGHVGLAMVLGHKPSPSDIKVEGKVRISDGKAKQAFGHHDIHGASATIDMTAAAVEARGQMLVKGVPAKASWQHVYGKPPDKQPHLRITATLDNADRNQLGLDLNELVQGEVGVEVTVGRDARGEQRVHLRADLTNAEVTLESVVWNKPKGRRGVFEFDVAKGTTYPTELRNVRLEGDNIAIEGWMGIGADQKVREFNFPQFSLNVITSLETRGRLRPDNVWEVTAKGSRYDARDLFQSFFDAGVQRKPRDGKLRSGLDLEAKIDTVVGHYDASLHTVRVTMQKRNDKLVMVDVRGMLEGGKPFAAELRPVAGEPRLLKADAQDAGQIFKLVGFYPHAVGGQMNLEVNLDGEEEADRVGTMWAIDFHVLGDPINVSVPEDVRPGERKRRTTSIPRQRFDFQQLKAPFLVGHGQFVLRNASVDGELLSATMTGKVDFRSRQLLVGGTFTPLSGLNRLFSDVPLFGPLVTGPRGEGVFAITYAIHGPLDRPELILNPFSAFTPGIMREFMKITPDNPRVVPPAAPGTRRDAARASSSPATGPPAENWPNWVQQEAEPARAKKKTP